MENFPGGKSVGGRTTEPGPQGEEGKGTWKKKRGKHDKAHFLRRKTFKKGSRGGESSGGETCKGPGKPVRGLIILESLKKEQARAEELERQEGEESPESSQN